jgi:hypothetical protein
MLDTVRDALESQELRDGVRSAVPLLAVLVGIALGVLLVRRGRYVPAPLAGIAFAAASLHALDRAHGIPDGLRDAAIAATIAGAIAWACSRLRPWLVLVGGVAAIPSALLVADLPEVADAPGWVGWLVLGMIVVGGCCIADFDRAHATQAWSPAMLAMTVGGIWATVPDTEFALVPLGVALVLLAPNVLLPYASIGPLGSFAAMVPIAWVVAIDSRGRWSAAIGSAACLGVFLVEPAVRLLQRRPIVTGPDPRWGRDVLVLHLGHAALVLLGSRVAGLRDEPGQAALIALVSLGAAFALLVTIRSRRPPTAFDVEEMGPLGESQQHAEK